MLLASAAAGLAQTKEGQAPDRPALTAEEQAAVKEFGELHKRLRIARLELALAEAKEAPEQEIATKAEDVYRLQGEMHAFRVKHPGIGRLARREGAGWREGRGRGESGWGRGQGMGRGGRHGMGGRGGGMRPEGRRGMRGQGGGMGGPWAGERRGRGMGRQMQGGCPFAEQGRGYGQGRGMGPGQGRGMGRGAMRGTAGGRGMGHRWQRGAGPATPAPDLPEPPPAPDDMTTQ